MDPNLLQWLQIIQEILAMWHTLQARSIAGLPVAPAIPLAVSETANDPTAPTAAPGALRAIAAALFPQLPPENYLDAAVMILDKGSSMGVQLMLNALNAGIVIDGKWGEQTTAAVKAYQTLVGLPPHGWTDDVTYAALVTESAKPLQERIKIVR